MEMHECLAEYTGVKLSGVPNPSKFVIENELSDGPKKATFVRSFADASGPAYGLLLDATGAPWRERLNPTTDLAAALLRLSKIDLPVDLAAAAAERAHKYDGASLAAEENAREKTRRAVAADYRVRLVEGTVLKIRLRQMSMQFDPGNLVSMGSLGTVYPNIRIVDDWGILNVTSRGTLLRTDFSQIALSRPKSIALRKVEGEGWTLDLKPGWSIIPGERTGDFTLQNPPAPPRS